MGPSARPVALGNGAPLAAPPTGVPLPGWGGNGTPERGGRPGRLNRRSFTGIRRKGDAGSDRAAATSCPGAGRRGSGGVGWGLGEGFQAGWDVFVPGGSVLWQVIHYLRDKSTLRSTNPHGPEGLCPEPGRDREQGKSSRSLASLARRELGGRRRPQQPWRRSRVRGSPMAHGFRRPR
jgi:hypothetical protein